MSAEWFVIAIFAVMVTGMCGWMFGYMTGQIHLLREQNDRAEAIQDSAANTGGKG